jgi:hypothetical protein
MKKEIGQDSWTIYPSDEKSSITPQNFCKEKATGFFFQISHAQRRMALTQGHHRDNYFSNRVPAGSATVVSCEGKSVHGVP